VSGPRFVAAALLVAVVALLLFAAGGARMAGVVSRGA
jgi:hypothetical protein